MGILDIFKKLTARVKESAGLEEEFSEEELGEEIGTELGKEGGGEAAFEEGAEPKEEFPAEAEKIAEVPEIEMSAGAGVEGLRDQLDVIKNKLDLVDAHLKTIESKEDIYKLEADRYMQYLTFISEKIDHVERELGEVERLVKKKE